MNNMRRKRINAVITLLQSIQEDVGTFIDEELKYFDNIPENIRYRSRGNKALDAAINFLNARDSLSEAIEYLEAAAE